MANDDFLTAAEVEQEYGLNWNQIRNIPADGRSDTGYGVVKGYRRDHIEKITEDIRAKQDERAKKKRCSRCKQVKRLTEFYRNDAYCKVCRCAVARLRDGKIARLESVKSEE